MHPERPTRKRHLLNLLLGLLTFTATADTLFAEPPLPLDLDDSRSALSIGEEMERDGQWLDAIKHYDRSLERWPADDDLKYAQRRARVHYRIERRYADSSFRESMLTMSQSEALELFDDASGRIRSSFVEPLSYLSIVAHGTESLYLALANPKFLEATLPPARDENDRRQRHAGVREMRRILREQYWNCAVHNSQHARQIVVEVAKHARQTLGIETAPVAMEYVFGSCNALDDYSGFLTPDRLSDLYSNIDGEFVGLGVEMKEVTGEGMLLVNVLPDSPAAVGGLRKGDVIVAIDNVDIRESTIDEAASLMRGLAGSRVGLKIHRDAEQRTWEAILIRRAVQVRAIPKVEMVDREAGIGYIQLAGFQKSTAQELDEAIRSLQAQNLRALVLDVRGNPGGLLTAAVEVLDRFIEDGVLVSTRGRTKDQDWTYRARRANTLNIPMALLIDGDSASASEIVAGAIRDHHRGTLVGRKTFGKWSVQSIFNVGRENGLRLTTARFYSPDGHTLSKIGVAPDVLMEAPTEHNVAYRAGEAAQDDADLAEAIRILRHQMK